MPVVVDSGPLAAAINGRDHAHHLASALLIEAGHDALVPDAVVAEVDYLVRTHVSTAAARRFLDALVGGVHQRVALPPSLFARATNIDQLYADLNLGIADASVMALAGATGSPILTFDFRDFRAAPPLDGGAWELVIDESDYERAIKRR